MAVADLLQREMQKRVDFQAKTKPLFPTEAQKGLSAILENRGDTEGDYLQLEPSIFKALQKQGKIRPELKFEDLDNKYIYDEVAGAYWKDLMNWLKPKDVNEAILWQYRPGLYKPAKGNIENIPDSEPGSFGKNAKTVMRQRAKTMAEFLRSQG